MDDPLKRLVVLDPVFQKTFDALFFVGRVAGASEFEMLALMHTQVSRALAQVDDETRAGVIATGSAYFALCHGQCEEVA